jgi:hypothetical protein
MNTPISSPAPSATPTTDPAFAETLRSLRPVFEMDRLTASMLEEMGLGSFESSTLIEDHLKSVDFSVLHFVILPEKSAWLDFLLETDRPSILKIYETFSGVSEAEDSDLEDMLRETMNMIHGALKTAFKKDGVDVIIPLVPQSIASFRLTNAPGGLSLQSRFVFKTDGIALRMTMIAHVAPITRKQMSNFRLAEVLVDPIAPEGDENLVIVKKHTMLNRRLLAKVHDMAEYDSQPRTHAIIEPSPLAKLIPHD